MSNHTTERLGRRELRSELINAISADDCRESPPAVFFDFIVYL